MTVRGRGPLPKDPAKRARTNKDLRDLRVIEAEPVPAPPLPEVMPSGADWPEQTRVWWQMWSVDPLTAEFRPSDWADLLDTAVVHGRFWSGDVRQAAELRLRVARHGATAEDRARLRITFAQADRADAERPKPAAAASRQSFGPLTA